MKRYAIILLSLIFLYVNQGYSQEKPFVFGFKVAPNIGWMKPDAKNYEREEMLPGFSWGFVAEFHLMENYTVTSGFNVVYLNANLKYPHRQLVNNDSTTGTLLRKYKLKYIEVPLILKMRTNKIGRFRFYGEIGIGTGFLLGAKADDEFKYNSSTLKDENIDISNDICFFRESLILGVGTEFIISGSTVVIIGVLFDNNFNNILNGENTVVPDVSNKAIANFLEVHIGLVF